ncbi:hypothetical protein LEP1GSC050_3906 [Leptospira broomii serovar Hurstbridge str. 5399]|uniref:Uncharacterized protein n=1 Tax=Leptospira broomii serovar Hurstbridge str. 5399 TaxID=1049789 RepID=T0F9X3_9LEPT|nr:hypothetical protein LEP1GSC050_3906 [Leptospira broomii serovar Hurstbridge str. 5399]
MIRNPSIRAWELLLNYVPYCLIRAEAEYRTLPLERPDPIHSTDFIPIDRFNRAIAE